MDGARPKPLLARLIIVAVALAGCAAPPPAPGAEQPAELISWTECGPGLDCATHPVPVDHADPDGETVPLAVVRRRATDPDERLGVLFVNPGGPGSPASDLVRALGTAGDLAFVSPGIAARYDVIGMDPRGIGGSDGVRCLTDEQREAVIATDLDPTVPGGLPLPELQERASTLRGGCAANVDPELLGAMATDAVARDMDLVRAALGEEEIAYLGVSYGTLLGATYATLFPERVARMVLDAPADPVLWREDPLRSALEQALGAEQQLDSWLRTCRAEGTGACPFGAGDPGRAFDALVARLEAQPLDVPASTVRPAGTLDGAATLNAARVAVFDRRLWPLLTAGLLAAEAGDGSVLVGLSQTLVREPDGSPSGLLEGNVAVNCLDRAVPGELARHEANALAVQQAAPRFGALSGYPSLSCIDWPGDDPARFTDPLTAAGAGPILVIGGREDSQTPYPWAEAMTAGLADGHLLTRDGVGHGSYRTSGPCVDTAVDAYLIGGQLPPAGATCPQVPPATTSLAALPTGG